MNIPRLKSSTLILPDFSVHMHVITWRCMAGHRYHHHHHHDHYHCRLYPIYKPIYPCHTHWLVAVEKKPWKCGPVDKAIALSIPPVMWLPGLSQMHSSGLVPSIGNLFHSGMKTCTMNAILCSYYLHLHDLGSKKQCVDVYIDFVD